jgi:hypothetical protein
MTRFAARNARRAALNPLIFNPLGRWHTSIMRRLCWVANFLLETLNLVALIGALADNFLHPFPRGLLSLGRFNNAATTREEITVKGFSAVATAMLVIGIGALSYVHPVSGQTDSGWITLFDGKNLDNWTPIGNANWRLEDGLIVADKGQGYLVSKDSYTDFEVRAEFWVSDDANSGVFLRCSDPANVTAKNAYEVNIFDQRPDPSYGTGAIVDVAKPTVVLKAGGKWNTYDIIAKGPKFTVTLNGERTVDGAEDSKHASGHIALQGFAGVVKFRKVEIKPL